MRVLNHHTFCGGAVGCLVSVWLSGCTTAGGKPADDSPFYQIPEGSELILNENLAIPPRKANVCIQKGLLLGCKQTDGQRPECVFSVRDRKTETQQVNPDTFVIYWVTRERERLAQVSKYRIASTGPIGLDRVGITRFVTRLYLRSTAQPEVRDLTCHIDEFHGSGGSQGHHLTVRQIRETLMPLFTLNLAR